MALSARKRHRINDAKKRPAAIAKAFMIAPYDE